MTNSHTLWLLFTLVAVVQQQAAVSASNPLPEQQQQQQQARSLQSNIDLATCTNKDTNYNIQLVNMGGNVVDARYVDAFELAAKRWSKVVVGDVPDNDGRRVRDWFNGQFDQPYSGSVDDLVIGYEISDTIDGIGGTLGGAGPVFIRQDSSGRLTSTLSGVMFFDGQDFDRMPINDVRAIIFHEMGHVLGLVGTTGRCNDACDSSNPRARSAYSCPLAAAEYEVWAPGSLLLENSGGMGTACGHWEEDVFRTQESSEVMTGFFEANLFQPLSSVTVAGLEDLGYEVDYCGADVWPANAETIKRFDVFVTEQTMDTDAMMDRISPGFGVDDNGDMNPLDGASDDGTSSSSSWTTVSGLRLTLLIVAAFCAL